MQVAHAKEPLADEKIGKSRPIRPLSGQNYTSIPTHFRGLNSTRSEGAEFHAKNKHNIPLPHKWGDKQYRSVRQNFLSTASDFKLTESIVVNSVDVSKTQLITHLKPQMICSGWGFAPKSQISGTKFWTYVRSGSWAHNMTRQGYLKIKGNWYLDLENSWGMNAHKNGDYMLVPAEVDDQWVRDAEIQTIGELILPESKPQV